MPIVTFWNNDKQAIGQTIGTSVATTAMALDHNFKTLLVIADFNDKTVERCFGALDSNKEIVKSLISSPQINLDSGIKGLLKLADSNRVTPEAIHDYTKIVFNNRLEILYSPLSVDDSIQGQALLIEKYKNIILNAARYYDYVFVDLKKGFYPNIQDQILGISDVVVMNVSQDIGKINDILNNNDLKTILKKAIWNICKYDKNSKYNIKNLTRTIFKKQTICCIPYNTLLFEAVQDGNLAELLIRFRTLKENDENNYLLMEQLRKLNETIITRYHELKAGL